MKLLKDIFNPLILCFYGGMFWVTAAHKVNNNIFTIIGAFIIAAIITFCWLNKVKKK